MLRLITLLSLFTGSLAPLQATDSTRVRSIFDDFYQPNHIVAVTLQFDDQELVRTKHKKEKFPGTISYRNAAGDTVTHAVDVQSRGKLRLKICDFPLLKLDFPKKRLQQAGFMADFDELKLITHCNKNGKNDIPVLKEWLVYQLYSMLTDKSLRAQLLHVRYLDLQGNLYADEMAFVIEPAEALAYRLGCAKQQEISPEPLAMNPEMYDLMILFQYMIGNVDWRVREMHNIEILNDTAHQNNIAIPYDFDYSGVVDAFYAVNDDRVGQKYFGERVLNGNFSSEAGFKKAVNQLLEKEEAILQTCANFTLLEEKERQRIVKYLRPFFDQIRHPKINSYKLRGQR